MTIKFRGYAHGPNVEADNADDMAAYLRVYFRDDPRGPVSSFKCEAYWADWMISGDHGVIGFCTAPIDINRRAPSEAVGLLRALMDRLDAHFGCSADWKEQEDIRRFLAAQDKEST